MLLCVWERMHVHGIVGQRSTPGNRKPVLCWLHNTVSSLYISRKWQSWPYDSHTILGCAQKSLVLSFLFELYNLFLSTVSFEECPCTFDGDFIQSIVSVNDTAILMLLILLIGDLLFSPPLSLMLFMVVFSKLWSNLMSWHIIIFLFYSSYFQWHYYWSLENFWCLHVDF